MAPSVPDEEIRIYGHSNLMYWWPVWALGFLLAFLTYLDGHLMAVVPAGTEVEQVELQPGQAGQTREVLVAPVGESVVTQKENSDGSRKPWLLVASNNNYGVVFIGAILFVIVVTNFTLRGLYSVVALGMVIMVGLIIALFGWWDNVLLWFGGLDVRMNAGGYLALAVPLFLIWAFSTFVYDRYTYLIVTRGQVRIRKEIGDGEIAVDGTGVLLTKERDDVFRHWLLGLGSGDIHVKTGGPANLDLELYNVVFIGSKLARIQELLREKEVATQSTATTV